jgi:cation diffusion facilitator CzcD-associated flavoprotein CzcO
MPHAEKPDMVVPDEPQCLPGRIKIIHVGMGASGLLAAHKAKKLLQNYELICYEKNETIGGTWLENRYPGCACDIPAAGE